MILYFGKQIFRQKYPCLNYITRDKLLCHSPKKKTTIVGFVAMVKEYKFHACLTKKNLSNFS